MARAKKPKKPTSRFVHEDPWRVFRIMSEFVEGFDEMSHIGPAVTIFGSARTKPRDRFYKATVDLSRRLAENNFAVITGGGPGIMEAANRGAAAGGGRSVGLNIKLPYEQSGNKYSNIAVDFHYFFARKVCLAKYSSAFIFMPGGFGTMDEFFEILTLIQTRKTPRYPMICYGRRYWNGLLKWANSTLKRGKYISPEDPNLVTVTDSPTKAIQIINEYHNRAGHQTSPPPAYA
jgi:uncharacterized protein (TIGR00730 family)|tara:strand:+ start:288 stop:986 length:699 start_codon:yes stop_codon:yes gene_type:complete